MLTAESQINTILHWERIFSINT